MAGEGEKRGMNGREEGVRDERASVREGREGGTNERASRPLGEGENKRAVAAVTHEVEVVAEEVADKARPQRAPPKKIVWGERGGSGSRKQITQRVCGDTSACAAECP